MAQSRSQEFVQVDTALTLLSQVNLLRESNAIALDIGGSLAKLVYLQPHTASDAPPRPLRIHGLDNSVAPALSVSVPVLSGTLHFFAFETANIHQLLRFIREHWADDQNFHDHQYIRATGGGAYKYAAHFRSEIEVELTRLDEMACAVAGLNFLLTSVDNEVYIYRPPDTPNPSPLHRSPSLGVPPDLASARHFVATNSDPFPYLLVNIGSGVSIVKVTGHDNFERVSGSSLGGGTFWGLSRLLLDCSSFDEVINLTNIGDNSNVDMLVGDIYGGSYPSLGLDSSVIAASFGKATARPPYKSATSSSNITANSSTKKDSTKSSTSISTSTTPTSDSDNKTEHANPQHNNDLTSSVWGTFTTRLRRAAAGSTALWLHAVAAVPPFGFILRQIGLKPDRVLSDAVSSSAQEASNGTKTSSNKGESPSHTTSEESISPSPSTETDVPSTRAHFNREDLALALLRMVSYNIGQIAHLNARVHGLRRIYFGGNFVRDHPYTTADISFAVDFWSNGAMKALFLRHDGYLGAIGAFINATSSSPTKVMDESKVQTEQARQLRKKPASAKRSSAKKDKKPTVPKISESKASAKKNVASSKPATFVSSSAHEPDEKPDQQPPAPISSNTTEASTDTLDANGFIDQTAKLAVESDEPQIDTNGSVSGAISSSTASTTDPAAAVQSGASDTSEAVDGSTPVKSGKAKRRKRSKSKKGNTSGVSTDVTNSGLTSLQKDTQPNVSPASNKKGSKKSSNKKAFSPILPPSTATTTDDVDDEGWTTVTRIRRHNPLQE